MNIKEQTEQRKPNGVFKKIHKVTVRGVELEIELQLARFNGEEILTNEIEEAEKWIAEKRAIEKIQHIKRMEISEAKAIIIRIENLAMNQRETDGNLYNAIMSVRNFIEARKLDILL